MKRIKFGCDFRYRNYLLIVPTIMICLEKQFEISLQWLWFCVYLDIDLEKAVR